MRGVEIHRPWEQGGELCTFYDFKIETPAGAGSIPMAEWNTVRDGKLAQPVSSSTPRRWRADAHYLKGRRMPSRPWNGYERVCPPARALDVIGERWTLVIVQELLKQPRMGGGGCLRAGSRSRAPRPTTTAEEFGVCHVRPMSTAVSSRAAG